MSSEKLTSVQKLESLILDYNKNPMNPKKFYLKYENITNIDGRIELVLSIGVSEKNALMFKQYVRVESAVNIEKELLYAKALEKILTSVYQRIDSDTLQDNLWSNIVRLEKEKTINTTLEVSFEEGKVEERETTEQENKINEALFNFVEAISKEEDFPRGFIHGGYEIHIIKKD